MTLSGSEAFGPQSPSNFLMARSFYLTTTLPYVNADPHIGFALEIVHADIIARHRRLLGDEVFFNTGTDEHGLKIYRAAQKEGKEPQAYVDEYAARFERLKEALTLSYDNFVRTTDLPHQKAAQEFWKRCDESGDIYKKQYKIKYCVGCELEKTDSELAHGKCSIHPNFELEIIEEENYFFRFSKYQELLLELYKKQPDLVIPHSRFNEVKAFVERGLGDFSISRLKEKMPWGIPVPGDDAHVMYVWFDALINYISAVGWPEDLEKFEKWWPVVQFAGKDQVRQQAAMWQAMLYSAKLPPSKQIVIHGFITSGGQKMSKSLGNVVDPFTLVEEYGTDAVRYYLARHAHPFEDSDFTMERFKEVYNANLANGLGNLVSRVMQMATAHLKNPVEMTQETQPDTDVAAHTEAFELNRAMDSIWERIGHDDVLIAIKKPFVGVGSDEASVRDEALSVIKKLVRELYAIAIELEPFMPETSEKIKSAVKANKKPERLFPRKE